MAAKLNHLVIAEILNSEYPLTSVSFEVNRINYSNVRVTMHLGTKLESKSFSFDSVLLRENDSIKLEFDKLEWKVNP